jgi:hypothetical protein
MNVHALPKGEIAWNGEPIAKPGGTRDGWNMASQEIKRLISADRAITNQENA